MLPEEEEVIKITPVPESLLITHNKNHGVYSCTEDGCSFSTPSPSLLGLHKAQAHNIHYMRVHMEKSFKCCKCEKGFSLQRDCLRHEKECGQIFTCPDCEKIYTNKGALKMHCLSKRHKTPPELCPKPKMPAVESKIVNKKPKKSNKVQQRHPIPILPKFSSQDGIPLIISSSKTTEATTTIPPNISVINQNSSFHVHPPVNVMVQNDNILDNVTSSLFQTSSQIQPPLVSIIQTPSDKKLYCDNVTQTIKHIPSQAKSKRHAPTQTQLSILERAMKSSNIPITKTSRATQKSMTHTGSRKSKSDSTTKRIKNSRKLTVATLTDPQRNLLSQNNGSQTIFSILYQNQPKSTAVNTSDADFKASMSTQTTIDNRGDFNDYNMSFPSQGTCGFLVTPQLSNSITQTFNSLLTPTSSKLFNSDTRTNLTQSSSSTTQTLECLASDTSTQTHDLSVNDNTRILEDLFPEHSGISVNTQTFGCFSSDMMTQTLDQLVNDDLQEIGTNTFNDGNSFVTNDTTTQTFDEMVDSITQTINSNISDCTTQTSLRSDITTQTFDNLGIDIMTQTFDAATSSDFDSGSQPLGSHLQTFDHICQTNFSIFEENSTAISCKNVGNNCSANQINVMKSFQAVSNDDKNLITEESTWANQESQIYVDIQSHQSASNVSIWNQTTNSVSRNLQEQETKKSICDERAMALQTESVGLWEFSEQSLTCLSKDDNNEIAEKSGAKSIITSNDPHVNPMADSMTQTLSLPDDDITLEALLSDMATQTFDEDDLTFDALLQSSNGFSSDFTSQTSQNLTNIACQTPVQFSAENERNTSDNEEDNFWEVGTQTLDDVREMALQTNFEDIWGTAVQMTQVNTMESGDERALVDNTFETGTQTTVCDDLHEIAGLQTFGNDLWEIGTQTRGHNAWEMGTQTGIDDIWEMATQTGEEYSWEMGTQTMGDNAWDTGTQTEGDNAWEMGTQTGGNDAWEMGTQTAGDDAWEMGTQTGGDDAWEIGTQTRIENIWEMGTQTGEDSSGETGTQTMVNLLTDTMTQTGDDLIDFLLTGKT